MGNLGFIGGESSGDLMDKLDGVGTVDFGNLVNMNGFSKSRAYNTPNDVFVLLLEKGHFDEGGGKDLHQKYMLMVKELLDGASVEEVVRFSRLVVNIKDYFKRVLEIRDYQSNDVAYIMSALRKQYDYALRGSDSNQAEKLLSTTEDLLDGISLEESDLGLDRLYSTVVEFSYAVEFVLYKYTGMQL